MELNILQKSLYNTPLWVVLSYILQHPEKEIKGIFLAKALSDVSQASVYNALQQLAKLEVLSYDKSQRIYSLNRSLVWVNHLMLTSNLISLQPLVKKLCDFSLKIILFGSRATSDYYSESDYDLFIVTHYQNDVRHIVEKNILVEQIQLMMKTPEEWLDLYKANPELYSSLQQGIVLWERK